MAYQSALTHSSLSRVAQAAQKRTKRKLEAVRNAGAQEVVGLAFGDRARRGVAVQPTSVHAPHQDPAAAQVVGAFDAERAEQQAAFSRGVVRPDPLVASP